MSLLTDGDRAKLRDTFVRFAEQHQVEQIGLSQIVKWLSDAIGSKYAPAVDPASLQRIRDAMLERPFTTKSAEKMLAALVASQLPRHSAIVALRCPFVDKHQPGLCTLSGPGCDSCIGRSYHAKSDGNLVWMGDHLFQPDNLIGGAESLGPRVASLTNFVLLHEFAHAIQFDGRAPKAFDLCARIYDEAAKLVPPALLGTRVIVGRDDSLEFEANSFSYRNCLKTRRD